MNAFATHGAVSWTELRTTDREAAARFYTALFGWETEEATMSPMPYTVFKVGDEAIGGIMEAPPGSCDAPPQWGSYVTVKDVDATLAKTAELGGEVLVEAREVPGVGRFGVIRDPQGAMMAVITYSVDECSE